MSPRVLTKSIINASLGLRNVVNERYINAFKGLINI